MVRASPSALLGPRQKPILYLTISLLWITGMLWLYEHYFAQAAEGTWTSTQAWSMKIHGAAAMLFLMSFGALILQHVPAGWEQGNKRLSGVSVISACGLLGMTGWGLYYVAGDSLRNNIGLFHGFLGLSLPLILGVHIWTRTQATRAKSDRRRKIPENPPA
jgi:hypothetical protein